MLFFGLRLGPILVVLARAGSIDHALAALTLHDRLRRLELFDAALDGAWRRLISRINLIDVVEEDSTRSLIANRVLRLHLLHGLRGTEAFSVRVSELFVRCLRVTHALAIVLEGALGGFCWNQRVLKGISLNVVVGGFFVGRARTLLVNSVARLLRQPVVLLVVEAQLADARRVERIVRVTRCHIEVLTGLRLVVLKDGAGASANLVVEIALGLLVGRPLERAGELLVRRLINVGVALVLLHRPRLPL